MHLYIYMCMYTRICVSVYIYIYANLYKSSVCDLQNLYAVGFIILSFKKGHRSSQICIVYQKCLVQVK